MSLPFKRALVTGGAGFIGSHIVDHLCRLGVDVVVYDNFSTGFATNLAAQEGNPRVRIVRGDVSDRAALAEAMTGVEAVFHFQANADVRGGVEHRRIDLEQNTIGTWNVLECLAQAGAKTLVFASSATVYGEPGVFPTPEDHPLVQTSLYGASKLAGEAMIQAYSEYFGVRSFVFRFVSWVGERYSHGVVFDFMKKLRANPAALDILGDGRQVKSYLDVRDGVSGIFTALAKAEGVKNVFNLGHDDYIPVMRVAAIIAEELGLSDVAFQPRGDKRGWIGDSPSVHLDTKRIRSLGWSPRIPIKEGIRSTVRYLKQNPAILSQRP